MVARNDLRNIEDAFDDFSARCGLGRAAHSDQRTIRAAFMAGMVGTVGVMQQALERGGAAELMAAFERLKSEAYMEADRAREAHPR
jgi:hypothetical protein